MKKAIILSLLCLALIGSYFLGRRDAHTEVPPPPRSPLPSTATPRLRRNLPNVPSVSLSSTSMMVPAPKFC